MELDSAQTHFSICNFLLLNFQRPFDFSPFSKWAPGTSQFGASFVKPGHIAQLERVFFYSGFPLRMVSLYCTRQFSASQGRPLTLKPVVQASPVTEKPLMASIAGHLNFWGVKTSETVDAVGVQPTASILLDLFGGDTRI